MNFEPDRLQCQAMTKEKKRCTYTATNSDGGKAFCERHVQIARRDRANAAPIKEKQK